MSARAASATRRLALAVLLAGCGPSTSTPGPVPPRHGRADDVVVAAVAETPMAPFLLPLALARVTADLERALFAAPGSTVARPRTDHATSLCEGKAAPGIDAPVERFVLEPPGDDDSPWSLELAGPLAMRPGPVDVPPATSPQPAVRLVLRSTNRHDTVDVTIESGGWLLCALATLRLAVDGTSVSELAYERRDRKARSLDVGVTVDDTGARISLELPAELVRSLLAAEQIEVVWEGGRLVLHPRQHEAIRSLVEHLDPVREAAALPTGAAWPESVRAIRGAT